MTDKRAAVLREVAARVDALPRPARVAIDGVTAAGKSTFAAELARLVTPSVLRVPLDGFHRAVPERYARGEGPESYYRDTFDLPTLRRTIEATRADTTVLVDGVFLLRPELSDLWNLTIFLTVDREVALARALNRDASRLGGLEEARARYEARYVPGETLYLEEVEPQRRADIVVENTDPQQPRLVPGV